MKTIEKHKRQYIKHWFEDNQEFNEGDRLYFEMPSFCSGDYSAKIYLDTDGDPYIKKSKSYYYGCRDLFISHKKETENEK